MTVFSSDRLGEQYTVERLASGMTLILVPMPAFRTTYACVSARIGSMDGAYSIGGGPLVELPDGIAHFLEHKLFENEDGDAFAKYAKTGANANAYTSFTNTSYLFSCTDRYLESLRILLDFVMTPWFTPESVAKEQGIIGQEIRMYDDDPDWQGYSALLGAMYSRVPLGRDIAGTQASIAKITAPLLHETYRAFYNPANLTMIVSGRYDADAVRALCAEMTPDVPPVDLRLPGAEEPAGVVKRRVTRRMAVSQPQFNIGFKELPLSEADRAFRPLVAELLLDMLVSDVSSVYRRLYDGGLVNDTFSHDVMTCRGHWLSTLSGESRDPDAVFEAVCGAFERARREGLSREAFQRSRRAMYGRLVKSLDNAESAAATILESHYANGNIYGIIEQMGSLRFEDAEALLAETFDAQRASMSVILPE